MALKSNISAIDLFCGRGGLSYGFKNAGIEVKAGVDTDETCRYAFETNCRSQFINKDVAEIDGFALDSLYGESNATKTIKKKARA